MFNISYPSPFYALHGVELPSPSTINPYVLSTPSDIEKDQNNFAIPPLFPTYDSGSASESSFISPFWRRKPLVCQGAHQLEPFPLADFEPLKVEKDAEDICWADYVNFTPASSPPPPEGAGVRSLPAPLTNTELGEITVDADVLFAVREEMRLPASPIPSSTAKCRKRKRSPEDGVNGTLSLPPSSSSTRVPIPTPGPIKQEIQEDGLSRQKRAKTSKVKATSSTKPAELKKSTTGARRTRRTRSKQAPGDQPAASSSTSRREREQITEDVPFSSTWGSMAWELEATLITSKPWKYFVDIDGDKGLASIPTELVDGRRLVLTMEERDALVKASKLSVPVYCNNRHKSPNRKGRATFACVLCFAKDRCAGERVGIEDVPNFTVEARMKSHFHSEKSHPGLEVEGEVPLLCPACPKFKTYHASDLRRHKTRSKTCAKNHARLGLEREGVGNEKSEKEEEEDVEGEEYEEEEIG